jgi:hypothetical protein
MAGRVTAVGGRAVFHAVRDRLGVRVSLVNLIASAVLNLVTLSAELAGVSIVLELATGVNYLIWVPIVAAAVWLVIWRLPFTWLENVFGLLGLALVVFVVALSSCRPTGTGCGTKQPILLYRQAKGTRRISSTRCHCSVRAWSRIRSCSSPPAVARRSGLPKASARCE